MPIDFPNSPTSGQTFTVGAITWQWDGSTWKALGSSNPGRDYVSASAPSSPAEGARWLNSNDLKTYTYYDSQWIESSPNLKGETGLQGAPAGNNVIINGAFDIWQRGTTFTNPGVFNYTTDRWTAIVNGAPTLTHSRQTFAPGAAPVTGYEGSYFLRQNVTGVSGSSVIAVGQAVEDVRTFAGQTVTLSFWAKDDAARTWTSRIDQNFGSSGSTSVGGPTSTFNVTTSWQRFSTTVAVASIAGKTIGANSHILVVLFGPSDTVQTMDIWGVQLEAGSVATPFRRNSPSIQSELAACQRYYYRWTAPGFGMTLAVAGGCLTTTIADTAIQFPVTMRTAPTSMDSSNVGWWNFGNNSTYTGGTTTYPTSTQDFATVRYTHTSAVLTAGQVGKLVASAAPGYLGFNAEI
jgi:hypothetical protein